MKNLLVAIENKVTNMMQIHSVGVYPYGLESLSTLELVSIVEFMGSKEEGQKELVGVYELKDDQREKKMLLVHLASLFYITAL